MKKLLLLLLSLVLIPSVYAADSANIKIKVNGAITNNRYFMCLPNVGCLSILAAKKGKVYPVLSKIKMSGIYVADTASKMRLNPQGLPASCNVIVNPKQTITISGTLAAGPNNSVVLKQLRCSLN